MVDSDSPQDQGQEPFKPAVDAHELRSLLPDQSTEVEKHSDPWADSPFGEAWGSNVNSSDVEIPVATVAFREQEAKAEPAASTEKKPSELKQERKEIITEAALRVSFDAEKIRAVLTEHPEVTGQMSDFARDKDVEQLRYDERKLELQRTLDAIAALPELDFQPGKTLIFGDNGVGKSTLAKALHYAVQTEEYADEEKVSLEEARKITLNLEAKTNSSSATEITMSGLAQFIAVGINVELVQQFGDSRYYDAAEIMGQYKHAYGGTVTQGASPEQIYDNGRSHRQTVDRDLFGMVEQETQQALKQQQKVDEATAKGEELSYYQRRHSGPQVYFFDEPEVGMSPRRQRQLEADLDRITYPGSTMIIPTNSIVMYDTDLPRIDLENYPERGIYRPSDFPDDER